MTFIMQWMIWLVLNQTNKTTNCVNFLPRVPWRKRDGVFLTMKKVTWPFWSALPSYDVMKVIPSLQLKVLPRYDVMKVIPSLQLKVLLILQQEWLESLSGFSIQYFKHIRDLSDCSKQRKQCAPYPCVVFTYATTITQRYLMTLMIS